MTSRQTLSQNQVLKLLEELPGWSLSEEAGDPSRISVAYVFKDFREAFTFMTSMAFVCEEMNHHPHMENIYKKVIIHISTHDANGVTMLDFEWARKVHDIYDGFMREE